MNPLIKSLIIFYPLLHILLFLSPHFRFPISLLYSLPPSFFLFFVFCFFFFFFFLLLLFLLLFFFCLCHPSFLYFSLYCFLHFSGHLIIFTSLILQLILRLWQAYHGISKFTLYFCSQITLISILSLCL